LGRERASERRSRARVREEEQGSFTCSEEGVWGLSEERVWVLSEERVSV